MSLLSFVTTCYFLLCDNDNEDDNEYDNDIKKKNTKKKKFYGFLNLLFFDLSEVY